MKYRGVSLLLTTFLPRRSVLFLRSLLPSPGCARLHRPEVNPGPFALCSRNSNGQKGQQKGWCLKMNGRKMVRCAQTNKLDSFARLDGITTSWAMMDFNSGLEACIRKGEGNVPSNRKVHLSTHANANTVYVTMFSPVKKR